MAKEIERKFLVTDDWRQPDDAPFEIKQGYLSTCPDSTVRVRVEQGRGYDPIAYITVKGRNQGISRDEYEFTIDIGSSEEMVDKLCHNVIHKTRTVQRHNGVFWEIDQFHGHNQGLIVAEVELAHEDQPLVLPAWLGSEVTDDPRYYNSNLSLNPYKNWN